MTTSNSYYLEIPEDLIGSADWGCWSHRNRLGQGKIAAFLAPRIASIMQWG